MFRRGNTPEAMYPFKVERCHGRSFEPATARYRLDIAHWLAENTRGDYMVEQQVDHRYWQGIMDRYRFELQADAALFVLFWPLPFAL